VTRTAVLSKITEILAELLDNPELQLTEESTADSVEDWDSVNHVKLLIALESDLGIQFATDEVNGVQNVGALIDVIQNKLAAGSSVAM
jgi:acyl carrier protein